MATPLWDTIIRKGKSRPILTHIIHYSTSKQAFDGGDFNTLDIEIVNHTWKEVLREATHMKIRFEIVIPQPNRFDWDSGDII